MEWPSEADFNQGIRDILKNDVRGESLHHLAVVAMQIVLESMKSVRSNNELTTASEVRQHLTGQLIDSFADETEFSVGNEIEIGDSAFYLLQDADTNHFVVQQLAPEQKIMGTFGTLVAIDTAELKNIKSKIASAVKLGGNAMPDAPAIVLEDLRFITPQGKSHALRPQLRAVIPLNLPQTIPRVAVPLERNSTVSF